MHMCVCIRRLDICVRTHGLAYAARVPKAIKGKFFYIKAKV